MASADLFWFSKQFADKCDGMGPGWTILGCRGVAVSVELFVDVVLTAAFTPILLTLP